MIAGHPAVSPDSNSSMKMYVGTSEKQYRWYHQLSQSRWKLSVQRSSAALM